VSVVLGQQYFEESTSSNTTRLRKFIGKHNQQQLIANYDKYGSITNDTIVIVVQVHNRIVYLRDLIESLAKASNISEALLIFSHDFYANDINELVQSIGFCRVLQIFYPLSIQTHPDEFPGSDPRDCARNLSKQQAIDIGCRNALCPDSFGHYREAEITQIKHHWWWKANRVFDELQVTRHHTGLVLFLEEDHYVAGDSLFLLRMMQEALPEACPSCNVLSLGTYQEYAIDETFNQVEIASWTTMKHNMGMAFNRETWNDIKSCTKHFCTFNDYNWDFTLLDVSLKCMTRKLMALVSVKPRVFHLGEW